MDESTGLTGSDGRPITGAVDFFKVLFLSKLFPLIFECINEINVYIWHQSNSIIILIWWACWQDGAGTRIDIKLSGFNEPTDANAAHGFHIHAGDSTDDECAAAGAHFNPAGVTHGARGVNSPG